MKVLIKIIKKFYGLFLYLNKLYLVCKNSKLNKEFYLGGFTFLTDKTFLGKNCNFNGLTVKGVGSCYIGDNFHSGAGCLIITSNHDYDNGSTLPYDKIHEVVKNVKIESNVWLGDRVIILPGVTIGEGSIIQAGSVVTQDIPAFSISGGAPCTEFKKRNIEHYNKLKTLKHYH